MLKISDVPMVLIDGAGVFIDDDAVLIRANLLYMPVIYAGSGQVH